MVNFMYCEFYFNLNRDGWKKAACAEPSLSDKRCLGVCELKIVLCRYGDFSHSEWPAPELGMCAYAFVHLPSMCVCLCL